LGVVRGKIGFTDFDSPTISDYSYFTDIVVWCDEKKWKIFCNGATGELSPKDQLIIKFEYGDTISNFSITRTIISSVTFVCLPNSKVEIQRDDKSNKIIKFFMSGFKNGELFDGNIKKIGTITVNLTVCATLNSQIEQELIKFEQ